MELIRSQQTKKKQKQVWWIHCQAKGLCKVSLSCHHSVQQIHYTILAWVQSTGGRAYMWDATFSLAIVPSLPVLHPHNWVKHDLIVGGEHGGGRASQNVKWTGTLDASGGLTSFSIEEQRSRVLPQSSWSLMQAVRVHGRHFNSRQSSGLNKPRVESSSGGYALPLQDFVLKMQVGLMRKGGVFARCL